jgi:sporulation protein YlmC with PRC-barrel domain
MDTTRTPVTLSATTMIGDSVRNAGGEDLGKIEELMIDLEMGRVAYAVLSFGGFLGMGDKLFAIPWSLLTLAVDDHEFILNVDKEVLKEAPGFDKDNWPNHVDRTWLKDIYHYYDVPAYWS